MILLLNEIMKILFFVSIILLVSGIFILGTNRNKGYNDSIIYYLIALLIIEILALTIFEQNLYLFSISSFLHFSFLIYFYFKNLIQISLKKAKIIIGVGVIPMIIALLENPNSSNYHSYDRVVYSFSIMLLGLFYFYTMLNEKVKLNNKNIRLNMFVLLFFSIDTFLAIWTNYLINENILLVAWIWMFRAIFLQLYYGSIIYYSWQIGKTR